MSDDAYAKVSKVIGDAMNDAWKKIIGDLANVAKGQSPISSLGVSNLSLDDIKTFFASAGGANLAIAFPSAVAREQVELFRAAVIPHGVAQAGGPSALISGEISIGVGIRF